MKQNFAALKVWNSESIFSYLKFRWNIIIFNFELYFTVVNFSGVSVLQLEWAEKKFDYSARGGRSRKPRITT
jgi:hypothetical protein